jgi:hypothetical protein
MLNQTEIISAIKVLLKHRRIKSNSEKQLFSTIVDDVFNHLKKQFTNITYIKDKIDITKDTTIEKEIADTKVVLDKWLRLLLSDDVVDQIDLDILSKFSLEISYEIIYNILDSFTYSTTENNDSFIILLSNSKILDKQNKIIVSNKKDIELIHDQINSFFEDRKNKFKT